MHADTATRQHWMSVLAHSQPAELAARLNALNITADYEVIRAAETGPHDEIVLIEPSSPSFSYQV